MRAREQGHGLAGCCVALTFAKLVLHVPSFLYVTFGENEGQLLHKDVINKDVINTNNGWGAWAAACNTPCVTRI